MLGFFKKFRKKVRKRFNSVVWRGGKKEVFFDHTLAEHFDFFVGEVTRFDFNAKVEISPVLLKINDSIDAMLRLIDFCQWYSSVFNGAFIIQERYEAIWTTLDGFSEKYKEMASWISGRFSDGEQFKSCNFSEQDRQFLTDALNSFLTFYGIMSEILAVDEYYSFFRLNCLVHGERELADVFSKTYLKQFGSSFLWVYQAFRLDGIEPLYYIPKSECLIRAYGLFIEYDAKIISHIGRIRKSEDFFIPDELNEKYEACKASADVIITAIDSMFAIYVEHCNHQLVFSGEACEYAHDLIECLKQSLVRCTDKLCSILKELEKLGDEQE